MKNEKVKKIKRVQYQLLNIKFITNPPVSVNLYEELIKNIFKEKISVQVPGGRYAIIRRMSEREIDGVKYIYGKFAKYTFIEGQNWLDFDKLEVQKYELPAGLFPNLRETDFVFIPKIHRFAIICNDGFNIGAVEKFFQIAVLKVNKTGHDIEVIIHQSKDTIKEILNAEKIEKIELSISYTNTDLIKDFGFVMDNEIKKSKAAALKMTLISNKKDTLEPESLFVKGGLDLAQSNGYAIASINNNGLKKEINTKDHPEKYVILCEEDDIENNIALKMIIDSKNE